MNYLIAELQKAVDSIFQITEEKCDIFLLTATFFCTSYCAIEAGTAKKKKKYKLNYKLENSS